MKERPELTLTMRTLIEIIEIKGKTSAKFWKDVKEGDIYEIRHTVAHKFNFQRKYQPVLEVFKDDMKVHEDTEGSFLNKSVMFTIKEI